jgi:beta-lactamase class D
MGSILIYDFNNNNYYSNDFNWAETDHLPASTFKIPHSLIALDLGIVSNENTILKWNGKKRDYKIWQQDLTFKQAFHFSCVPCYQEIAQQVGEKRMNEFVRKFNYGDMEIYKDNIDTFWLTGNSKISQFEQIDFLKRLYLSKLPISKNTEQIFKELFIVNQNNDFTLRAKTGLSINNEKYNGWYVGYLERQKNIYFFATNISPKDKYQKMFNKKRKDITINALKQLNILPQ